MKKILMVTNLYPSKKRPEFGVFVCNIYKTLCRVGFLIDIAKCADSGSKVLNYIYLFLSVVFKLTFKKYDIIYCHFSSHTFFVHYLVQLFSINVKVITHLHGSDAVATKGSIKYFLSNYSIKNSHLVVCPSLTYKNYIIRNYKLDDDKLNVYPSGGVNDRFYQQGSVSNELKTFGYIGRIINKKGVFTLAKAFKLLLEETGRLDLKLVYAGDGHDLKSLKKYIIDEEIKNIEFIQPIQYEFLASFFNSIDFAVFPTEFKYESLGLVGLEAFTLKTPLIGSDALGPLSYMNDDNSFIFKLGEHVDLKNKMLDALSKERNVIEGLVFNAYATAEKYKASKVTEEFSKVLNKL